MAERMCLFDWYSNTLLVSLNNRISIRDTYGVRGGVVDCQDMADPNISSNFRSESMTGTMIAETERPQKDLMGQPVAETEVRESKSHNCIWFDPFSWLQTSSDADSPRPEDVIYGSQMGRRLESDSH